MPNPKIPGMHARRPIDFEAGVTTPGPWLGWTALTLIVLCIGGAVAALASALP
jgi:hypothetical protein